MKSILKLLTVAATLTLFTGTVLAGPHGNPPPVSDKTELFGIKKKQPPPPPPPPPKGPQKPQPRRYLSQLTNQISTQKKGANFF